MEGYLHTTRMDYKACKFLNNGYNCCDYNNPMGNHKLSYNCFHGTLFYIYVLTPPPIPQSP